ncbi:hypothetical protein Phum_PHUM121590 [Pediculus humanus corporis]|uniref:Uncharacterized protein n=1 Tax=Pediculus humanus subsp. corporis TaxID=121224 RepID=E0VDN0_PEDHC|nr:uncharacterized protein Phum_PHUM121590 [Pediculus humanus corporis]EEB11486.1 hypothetical protein Phum_PHUM121590 [Pediculus humanus corporis]
MAEGGISPETPVHSRPWTGRAAIRVRAPHRSVPNPNDSECHRKSGDNIMCVPPDVTTPTHPTDFSLKFNNNIPRFLWNDPRTIIDNKKIDMLQQRDHGDIIKNINTESDNYNNVYGGNNRENNQRIADFIIANKEYRNNFNIGQPSSDSAIGYVNKEQTRMRATDFAVALNYNKDLHRTSDFAGMILQHHQRALGLSLKPAHLSTTASLQHNSGPRHTIDAILGLGSRRTPPIKESQENSNRNGNESSGILVFVNNNNNNNVKLS